MSKKQSLYRLLDEALPKLRGPYGKLDVAEAAAKIGIGRAQLYNWLKQDRFPAKHLMKVSKITGSQPGDLLKFVITR